MYLIIGASSFIGNHLYNYFIENGIEVIGTYFTHPYNKAWIRFDLCSGNLEELCHTYLEDRIPEAVIICGADTSIDHCISNEAASTKVNVEGTKKVIDQAGKMGIKIVFLSSEAVFDGKKGMYTEEDMPNPVTLYGRQKLEIERYMSGHLKEYLIFRISRAVGSKYGEKDIFCEFYNKIIRHEEIVCLENQSFCVTDAEDIAKAARKALELNLSGLYHLSSKNYISRYRLAAIYVEKIVGFYKKISEKKYSDLAFIDNRHVYGGLNGTKLERLLKISYKDIETILDSYAKSMPEKQYLILGAEGNIGSYVYGRLRADGKKTLGTAHHTDNRGNLLHFDILKDDICNLAKEFNQREKVAVVCIGQSNIKQCCENYKQAYEINVIKTKELIHTLCQNGFYVIFFSTDNVFDGKEGGYTESSKTNAVNKYGSMKEEMEQYLLKNEPDVCILRLSKVVDTVPSKQNIFYEWEKQAEDGDVLCIRGNRLSFVAMEDVYQACLLAGNLKLHGLYNIVGDVAYSRAELAGKFYDKLGKKPVKIRECDANEINLKDNRPLNISMDNEKFKKETGYQFMSMDDVIEQYIANKK